MEPIIVPSRAVESLPGGITIEWLNQIAADADALVIESNADVETGKQIIDGINGALKVINETLGPQVKTSYDLYKADYNFVMSITEPLEKRKKLVKDQKIAAFLTEQARQHRKAEEERLEAARKEKDRLIDEARVKIKDLLSISGEVSAQISALEGRLDDPGLGQEEEYVIKTELVSLKAKLSVADGGVRDAQASIEQTRYIAPSSVPSPTEVQKTVGITGKMVKEPIVTNKRALAKFIVNTPTIPFDIIQFDLKLIKELINKGVSLEGVEYEEKVAVKNSARGKRG